MPSRFADGILYGSPAEDRKNRGWGKANQPTVKFSLMSPETTRKGTRRAKRFDAKIQNGISIQEENDFPPGPPPTPHPLH